MPKTKRAKGLRSKLRADGTLKGQGYFGPLQIPTGKTATEYSIGVMFDKKETQIPTLVPTLTKDELNWMINDIIPRGEPVPESIINKAVEHALRRKKLGQSPFAK